MKAVLYARFSPRPDSATSDSADHQLLRLRRWAGAEERSYEVVSEHRDEGVSGNIGREGRPGLEAAIKDACEQGAVLAVLKLDRLARSVKHVIEIMDVLSEGGAHFASMSEHVDTSTAVGKLVFQILAAFAEFERSVIVERTSNAMRLHQEQGRAMSHHPPFGYRKVGECLVDDKDEQEAIEVICELHERGVSYRQICRELERLRIQPRGESWNHKLVKRIIQRRMG